MTVGELCERDVVNMASGVNLGRVDDIAFSEATAGITHIVLYGKLKLFGLLGREEDTYIPWSEIQKIGQDVLLIDTQTEKLPQSKRKIISFK